MDTDFHPTVANGTRISRMDTYFHHTIATESEQRVDSGLSDRGGARVLPPANGVFGLDEQPRTDVMWLSSRVVLLSYGGMRGQS